MSVSIEIDHDANKSRKENSNNEAVKNFGHMDPLKVLFKIFYQKCLHFYFLHPLFFEKLRKSFFCHSTLGPKFIIESIERLTQTRFDFHLLNKLSVRTEISPAKVAW